MVFHGLVWYSSQRTSVKCAEATLNYEVREAWCTKNHLRFLFFFSNIFATIPCNTHIVFLVLKSMYMCYRHHSATKKIENGKSCKCIEFYLNYSLLFDRKQIQLNLCLMWSYFTKTKSNISLFAFFFHNKDIIQIVSYILLGNIPGENPSRQRAPV